MKNTINKMFLVVLLCALSLQVLAQNFSGRATYKTAASMDIPLDEDGLSAIEQKAMQQQIAKALQREYTLSFNSYESTYKRVENLDASPEVQSGGVVVRVANTDGVIYRNTRDKLSVEKRDLFGKPFVIEDKPTPANWQIENEYKNIGNYRVQKATYTRPTTRIVIDSENKNLPKEEIDSVEVVAWFATEIPISHGPDSYWGLPGLIMEVNSGSFATVCTKLELNPKDGVEVFKPTKGKSISREEFEVLNQQKMEEMMGQYDGKGEERKIIRMTR